MSITGFIVANFEAWCGPKRFRVGFEVVKEFVDAWPELVRVLSHVIAKLQQPAFGQTRQRVRSAAKSNSIGLAQPVDQQSLSGNEVFAFQQCRDHQHVSSW